jgi:hypothetical protein
MLPETRVWLTRLLLTVILGFVGCRGLPFGSDSSEDDTVSAPDFGLNTVPRQWEPAFEDGDTTRKAGGGKAGAGRLTDDASWGDSDAEETRGRRAKAASVPED